MSRRDVSQRLKCTQTTIQRLESEGRLTATREPKPNGRGYANVWYDSDEVDKLAREWRPRRALPERADTRLVEQNVRGKVAARAFKILDETRGQNIEDVFRRIVIETEADPALVRQVVEEWELGVARAKSERRAREVERDNRERQIAHEKRDREEKFRQWKLKLATIEATGKKRA